LSGSFSVISSMCALFALPVGAGQIKMATMCACDPHSCWFLCSIGCWDRFINVCAFCAIYGCHFIINDLTMKFLTSSCLLSVFSLLSENSLLVAWAGKQRLVSYIAFIVYKVLTVWMSSVASRELKKIGVLDCPPAYKCVHLWITLRASIGLVGVCWVSRGNLPGATKFQGGGECTRLA
jgi:hypothetical protein